MKIRTYLVLVAALAILGSAWLFSRKDSAGEKLVLGAERGLSVATEFKEANAPGQADATVPTSEPAMDPKALFAYVPRPDFADTLEARLPAPARQIRYVELNRALLEGKQSPLWMPSGLGKMSIVLPDGRVLNAVIDRSEMLDGGRFTSQGHIEGQPASRVLIAGNSEGQYSASVLDVAMGEGDNSHLTNYTVRATGGTVAQFYEVDDSLVPPCGGVLMPVLDKDAIARIAEKKMAGSTDTTLSATASAEAALVPNANPIVDLMMLYTPAVINSLFGTTSSKQAAIQSTFDLAVAQVNTDFSRSNITSTVRLVKTAMTNYVEDNSVPSTLEEKALTSLRQTSDGQMDEIHALRDQVGADLVCLVIQQTSVASGGSIGIGYLLGSPSVVDPSANLTNDVFAFSVVNFGYINGYNLVSHELGHNFGAQHDRDHATKTDTSGATVADPGAFSYSYGYVFYGLNGRRYRTIMAYEPSSGPSATRLSYFSNPEVIASETGVGVAVGVAVGQTTECDNALTLQKTAFEVSGFRKQMITPFYAGRMLGLSTRAYVGPGEQQLIGGIAISGTKLVILRASGPSMTAQGVTGVLANPKLTLNQIVNAVPQLVPNGINDDWGTLANRDAYVAACVQVHLNPLSSPLESALLLTLNGGAYSSSITGSDGGTGIALMEAYEVANTGDLKLFGISTRGYAGVNGREMIAGLNVDGVAGQTKRIIVKVLGPTLTQQGVSSGAAMVDPMLELHLSDGTLLMSNDDWTSDSVVTNGTRDDFQPLVKYYHETEISNTGFAPKNRREPAIMVDLLPGIYTVVAKPFEDLPTNQVAQPGVVMVEVYELQSNGKVN